MTKRGLAALCAAGLVGTTLLVGTDRAVGQEPGVVGTPPPAAISAPGDAVLPPLAASPNAPPPPAAASPTAPPSAIEPISEAPATASSPSAPTGTASHSPTIDLPPEAATAAPNSAPSVRLGVSPNDDTLSRGLAPQRLAQPGTVVGGYGQFDLNALRKGTHPFDAHANVRRVVLFVAHPITDDIRIYTEFEWENALACSSCVGSAEIEQAFVQWRLRGDALALRAGLVLIPMGIVNEWHEPPVFHGVERPMVDQLVIPTTWRELGIGAVGTLAEIFRYQLYLTTSMNPLSLSESGLGGALQQGAIARAKAFAVTGRAEVEPWLGVIAGASFFLSNLGPNGDYFDANHQRKDLTLPLLGYALDARMRRFGFEARVVWSQFFLPNSDALLAAFNQGGGPVFPVIAQGMAGPVPERIQGGYIELAYNVLSLAHVSHELFAFARLETYNTQAAVPKGYAADPALDVRELTLGLTYRPISQLVFKTDLQLRDRRLGLDEIQYNLGFGYMF